MTAVSASEPVGFELPLAGTTGYGIIDLVLCSGDFNDLDARSATKSTGTGGFDILNNASVALG